MSSSILEIKNQYKLVHVIKTHRGADDKAFRCVYQEKDDIGKTGVMKLKDIFLFFSFLWYFLLYFSKSTMALAFIHSEICNC